MNVQFTRNCSIDLEYAKSCFFVIAADQIEFLVDGKE